MTQFNPSIRLRRMTIERAGRYVYDENFHPGVNIIRGENSSGKSTILNFIHYGLGGDVSEWSETALLCDRVTVEAELSGNVVTLTRHVSDDSLQPMEVYFGSHDEAIKGDRAQWQRFPYRRSQTRESFSQILFRLLGMPEAANDESGSITMHQVMRLLYADQLSPVDELFAHEGFDNPKIREAVGKLLCGAFDNELYANELEIKVAEKRYDSISAELSSLYRALGQAGHDLTILWVNEQRSRTQQEREAVEIELARLQKGSSREALNPTLKAQEDAYDQLVARQRAIAALQEERDAIELAIADSASFIRSLEDKLAALKDAALVADEVGGASFTSCPACYAEVVGIDDAACALCKEPYDVTLAAERLGGMINETALQLRQSRLLQEDRATRQSLVEASLSAAESEWRVAARRYADAQARPTDEQEYAVSELYKRLGYLDRREEDLAEKAKMIQVAEGLSAQKAELNEKLGRLKARNDSLKLAQEARLNDAYFTISGKVRRLLSRDLKRQDSFESPQRVDFSFGGNRISVDGHTYFSASSRAILKSAFILGFHEAAATKEYFRHPRFVMLDTIEDKGMEPARSKNFQHLIVEAVGDAPSESQVIFGTAMIAEELDNDSYVVGRFYTRDHRSLDIG